MEMEGGMSTIALADLSEKHYSRQIAGDIGEICEPLRAFGITHFLYARFFNDGSGYHLTDCWDAYYHHCKNKYLIGPPVSKEIFGDRFFYLPAMGLTQEFSQAYYDWQNLFNIGQPIYFIERYTHYIDLYIYGADPNNSKIINFYANNVEILEKFKYFFKDKAAKIIAKANKNKIILPKEMSANFHRESIDSDKGDIQKQEFLKQLEVKNYILSGKYEKTSISQRELDVIKHLAVGATFKEVGKLLTISPRTVEAHLNNLKFKLKLSKKSDIIKIITDFNLL